MSTYKYFPSSQTRLFAFDIPAWVPFLPKGLWLVSKSAYNILEEALARNGLTLSEITSIANGKLPSEIHEEVLRCEREIDSTSYRDPKVRQALFNDQYLEALLIRKQVYISQFIEKIIRTVFALLPNNVLHIAEENLNKMGLTLEDAIPLIKGKGSPEAYMQVAYQMAVHLEQTTLLGIFEFLRNRTGSDTTLTFSSVMSNDETPLPTVWVEIKSVNTGESQTIHFPDIVPWAYKIIQHINEEAQQHAAVQLNATSSPTLLLNSHGNDGE